MDAEGVVFKTLDAVEAMLELGWIFQIDDLRLLVIPDRLDLIRIGVHHRAGVVTRNIQNLKTPFHLVLHKLRSTLETNVRVLIEDGAVMFVGIFAALNHEQNQAEELGIGVIGIINMRW